MAPHPLIGKQAPSFTLTNYNGESYEFQPGQGSRIALFFYPKSGSYGCTRQVCQFRDALESKSAFKDLQVIGVSPDSIEKQAKFAEAQKLTYPLLSDADGQVRKAYSVGRGLLGLVSARITFCIDSDGIICEVLESTLNHSAHSKFVGKWLAKSTAEKTASGDKPEEAVPADGAVSAAADGEPSAETEAEGATVEAEPEPSLDIPRVSEHPPQL